MSESAETNESATEQENTTESAEISGPVTHRESNTESEDDDSDSDTDFDPEEIEKEIMGVKSMLRRYCGRHKVTNYKRKDDSSMKLRICYLQVI